MRRGTDVTHRQADPQTAVITIHFASAIRLMRNVINFLTISAIKTCVKKVFGLLDFLTFEQGVAIKEVPSCKWNITP